MAIARISCFQSCLHRAGSYPRARALRAGGAKVVTPGAFSLLYHYGKADTPPVGAELGVWPIRGRKASSLAHGVARGLSKTHPSPTPTLRKSPVRGAILFSAAPERVGSPRRMKVGGFLGYSFMEYQSSRISFNHCGAENTASALLEGRLSRRAARMNPRLLGGPKLGNSPCYSVTPEVDYSPDARFSAPKVGGRRASL